MEGADQAGSDPEAHRAVRWKACPAGSEEPHGPPGAFASRWQTVRRKPDRRETGIEKVGTHRDAGR